MIEYILYMTSMLIFFFINLRILQALHIENKFEKMKLWEIKTAYFMIALVIAHILSEMILRIASLSQLM
ncbi:MAG TPA: hypothetical protein DC003_01250 [Acholeplasmataceae bacterium]|nr:hypothetical protein [Acholeplasmataceae bacterium]